jgi:hypothetical protein
MGSVKKEIALLGDMLNTAAHLVDACGDSGESVIASADFLDRLVLPPGRCGAVARPDPTERQGIGHRALRAGPGDA